MTVAVRPLALAVAFLLAGCSRSLPKGPVILDCDGPQPNGRWTDSYTIDLQDRRYCEADCGSIASVRNARVTLDLFADGIHPTVIDMNTGRITMYSHTFNGGWSQVQGQCRRVRKSRWVRLE